MTDVMEQVEKRVARIIRGKFMILTPLGVAKLVLSIPEILIKDPDQSLPEEYNLHGSIVADKMLKEHWVKVK